MTYTVLIVGVAPAITRTMPAIPGVKCHFLAEPSGVNRWLEEFTTRYPGEKIHFTGAFRSLPDEEVVLNNPVVTWLQSPTTVPVSDMALKAFIQQRMSEIYSLAA